MIIRENPAHFTCINQNDHAQFSGWMASLWGNEHTPAPTESKAPLVLATALHDVGWITIDNDPHWNPDVGRPYSFMDEPLDRKLPQYVAGVDRVAKENPYSALLCSMHYVSFFPPSALERLEPQATAFVKSEEERQNRLKETLDHAGRVDELTRAEFDLGLLKLCDNLSLYVALNKPRCPKEKEHPWYRDGFPPTTLMPGAEPVRFQARWLDSQRVAITPYPFREPLPYTLPYRRVSKAEIETDNFNATYISTPISIQVITFVPNS